MTNCDRKVPPRARNAYGDPRGARPRPRTSGMAAPARPPARVLDRAPTAAGQPAVVMAGAVLHHLGDAGGHRVGAVGRAPRRRRARRGGRAARAPRHVLRAAAGLGGRARRGGVRGGAVLLCGPRAHARHPGGGLLGRLLVVVGLLPADGPRDVAGRRRRRCRLPLLPAAAVARQPPRPPRPPTPPSSTPSSPRPPRPRRGSCSSRSTGCPGRCCSGRCRAGDLPTLTRWVRSGSHTATTWDVQLPSTTPASQAGLLHGASAQIPAFRWYEKESGRLLVANHPRDAAVIQQRLQRRPGPAGRRGRQHLQHLHRRRPDRAADDEQRRPPQPARRGPSRGYAAFFINPYGLTRSLVLTVGEMVKELLPGPATAQPGRAAADQPARLLRAAARPSPTCCCATSTPG